MHWKFAPGFTGQNALLPKDNGYVVYTIVYSPDEDITHSDHFNPRQQKPLSGSLQTHIMEKLQDVQYLRGPKGMKKAQAELKDYFSEVVTNANTYFNEDLKFNPTKSNSYCASEGFLLPFHQTLWAITDVTRGRPNACTGSHQYDLDEEMKDLTDDLRPSLDGVTPNINYVKLKNSIDSLQADNVCRNTSTKDNALQELLLDTAQSRKRKLKENPAYDDFPWSTVRFFDNTWLDQIKTHQTQILPLADIRDDSGIKSWFEYLPNRNDPKRSKYRCRICNSHFKTYSSNPILLKDTPLALPDGILLNEKGLNRKEILNHATNSKIHRDLVNALKTSEKISLEDINFQVSSRNAVSARVFAAMFLGVNSLGVAIDKLPEMLKLLKVRYRVELGKGCTSSWSHARIIHSISYSMQDRLLIHMRNTNDPIVVLFDGSTDRGNYFIFQLLCNVISFCI